MRRIVFLFLGFLLHPISNLLGQQALSFTYTHLTYRNGLLHNEVISITQDAKGFMWIYTTNGLQRFDGLNFKNYPDLIVNPEEGIAYNAEIFHDKSGDTLWVTSNEKIEMLDVKQNKWKKWDAQNVISDPSCSSISFVGLKSKKWYLKRNIVYYYDSIQKKNFISNINSTPSGILRTACMSSNSDSNQIYISAKSQILLLDKIRKKVLSREYNPDHNPLLNIQLSNNNGNEFRFLMQDSKKNVWVTTWGDLFFKYSLVTKKINQYSLREIRGKELGHPYINSGLLINCFLEDKNHVIWIGTENVGLLRYNSDKDNFDFCTSSDKNISGIQYTYKIFTLFQDKDQNIWIGTDRGISIFNPSKESFNSLYHYRGKNGSTIQTELTCFFESPQGSFFLGTWGGGIEEYDRNYFFKRNIRFSSNSELNLIWCFLQVDKKRLWIGCQKGRLISYNFISGKSQFFSPRELNQSTIRCMVKDKEGDIYLGLNNGKIVKWEKKQNKFIAMKPEFSVHLDKSSSVNYMFLDCNQRLWVSTNQGFKEFDKHTMRYSGIWLPSSSKHFLVGKTCNGIEQYNDSILLIGCNYGGISQFNTRSKTFTTLPNQIDFGSHSVYALKKDQNNNIWFTTDYGLFKYTWLKKKFISYRLENGLINAAFKSNDFYSISGDKWLTFTTAEAISFSPLKLDNGSNFLQKIVLTKFNVIGDSPLPLNVNQIIKIPYFKNSFNIEYADLIYFPVHETTFYFRLIGLNKQWINNGSQHNVSYNGLSPGVYSFEVRAENGLFKSPSTFLTISITPPFWRTHWFVILLVIIILSCIYLIITRREQNLNIIANDRLKVEKLESAFYKNKLETASLIQESQMEVLKIQEQLSTAKLEALRSQMNPHFIFNCINSIDGLIQMKDQEKATLYLNKFAKLLRNILDASSKDMISFLKDYNSLKLYIELEELRSNYNFVTVYKLDSGLEECDYLVPPLIAQPYVENAIIHGLRNKKDNNGVLQISIKEINQHIQYEIQDNGIGRCASEKLAEIKDSHFGSYLSAERIRLFNKERYCTVQIQDLYENQIPAGTKVTIQLKVGTVYNN